MIKGYTENSLYFNTDGIRQKIFIYSMTYFLTFIPMFKGKVHLYKNVDGKEEEIKKNFDNEKEFNAFVDKNPELKKLQEFKWKPIKWPSLSGFKDLLEDTKRL